MARPLIIVVLATVALLLGLVVGVVVGRPHLPLLSKPASSLRRVVAASGYVGQSFRSEPTAVIRLAGNPSPIPPFMVNDLDGNLVSTAEWHGKAVLLNFWATWCPSCREEIPQLIDLATRYKDRLQVIGVSMDDDPPAAVKQFAKRAGINYPVVMATREMLAAYGGVPALPTTFVVDVDSHVVQKHIGLHPRDVYENEIRALLGMPVDATVETFTDIGQIFLKKAALATELPGVDFTRLTSEQKKAALKRMNSENCNCGCRLTIAQCRIIDTACPISQKLAANIIKAVLAGASRSSNAAQK